MSGLTIIKPLAITPAMLTSTDVPEADYAAYAGGTTYAADVRVIDSHLIYQSLQASNTGHTPATSPTWWVQVSATNRYKLFDLVNSSQTAQSTSMTYTVRPGVVVNSIAAVNMQSVYSIRVRMTSDAYGLVYDQTISRSRLPSDASWWAWFFGARTAALTTYTLDLPSFVDAAITVDFTGLSDMAVGNLIFGTVSTWGLAMSTAVSLGIRDYSKKETNEWGDIVLTQRAFAKKAQFPLVLAASDVDALFNHLATLRATPCVWIGSSDFTSTVVYGFYQDFEIIISYPLVADCNLTLEGLA